ncbi:hypothetical protein [Bartonella taylorii]|uniref:Uncharacterized protein n=1 Tax=Bartonella taylorii TaxID=33046 RepID=A0A9Q9DM22_BARTA|nr:hypothetical protein [Bartonella taylorii]USP02739.1 hypothetical protein LAJ60_07750 [Bartonella taylorii]
MAQALQCQVASAKDDFASENETVHGDLAAKMYGLAAHNLADEMYYRFLNNKGGEYDKK